MRRVICGLVATGSFLAALGFVTNSDLGYEPDFRALVIKVGIACALCIGSAWIGGFLND